MKLKAAVPFVVPVLVAIYLVLFWNDLSGSQIDAAGFPRLLIACIALLLVIEVVKQGRKLRRSPAAVTGGESVGDAPLDAVLREKQVATESFGTRLEVEQPSPVPPWRRDAPMFAIIAFLLGYWLLLPLIGAYPSTALFVAGLSVVLGYRKPLLVIASTVICVAIVGGFIRLFNLPLPMFWS